MQSNACGCITTTSRLVMLMNGSYLNAWVAAVISPTLNPYTCVHMPRFGPGSRPTTREAQNGDIGLSLHLPKPPAATVFKRQTFIHVPQSHRFWLPSFCCNAHTTPVLSFYGNGGISSRTKHLAATCLPLFSAAEFLLLLVGLERPHDEDILPFLPATMGDDMADVLPTASDQTAPSRGRNLV